MSIYTKTGDKGTTSLFDGTRVKKNSLRVETYGTFDELNAQLSIAEKVALNKEIKEKLNKMQHQLFYLSAEIATKDTAKLSLKSTLINENDIKELEQVIDKYSSSLPKVDYFVLPGSSLSAAQIHLSRTVCRRAERLLNELSEKEDIREVLLVFTNRLSDCLYMFARIEDREVMIDGLVNEIIKRYELLNKPSSNTSEVFTFDKVEEIIKVCIAKAKQINVPVSISIVDKSAQQIAFYKMPDCLLVSSALAYKKAYTSVAMKSATHTLQKATQPGSELYQIETSCDGNIVTFGGGFPLYDKKQNILGAIGISGGSVEEDITIALTGKQVFEDGE